MGNHEGKHEQLFQPLLCPTRKITQKNMTLLNEFFPFWKLHITSRQFTLKIIIFYTYNNTCCIGNARGLPSDIIPFSLLFSHTSMKYLTLPTYPLNVDYKQKTRNEELINSTSNVTPEISYYQKYLFHSIIKDFLFELM